MKCDGACEQHVGDVIVVMVKNPKTGKDWGRFHYCEEAIAEDKRSGFIVNRMSESD